jgi:hypothetical protein
MKFHLSRTKKIIIIAIVLLVILIAADLFAPWHTDLRKFEAAAIAELETDMWHAYYDKESFRLFRLLVKMLHDHQGFPYLQASYQAYLAAQAAMVFKKGHERKDFELALPYLIKYYDGIKRIGQLNCNPEQVAKAELEWWIIHRERLRYGEAALVKSVAVATGSLYSEDPEDLMEYAQARTDAMIIRDDEEARDNVSDQEWKQINTKLLYSYQSLATVLNQKNK